MTEKKIPELRFSEFSGEWEEKRLGDVASQPLYGLNAAAKKYDGVNKYIRITDISDNNTFSPHPLVSPEGKVEDKFKLRINDIVFARTGATTGKTYLYDSDDGSLFFAGFLIKFSINEKYSSKFIFLHTLRNEYRKWVRVTSMRSGQPGINSNEYKSLKLNIPTLKEQTKIASFLTSINDKIELLTSKKKSLEEYKKGMMQRIFKREIRFKDDDGSEFPEWEEKKLDSLVNFQNGKAHEGIIVDKGEFIVVNSKFISSEGKIKKFSNLQVQPLVKKDITIVMSDIPNGKAIAKCFYIDKDGKYTLNQRIGLLRVKKEISSKFLFYLVNRNSYFLKFDSGVGQTNLRKKEILDCPLMIPQGYKEQKKIADFLASIDKKIEEAEKEISAVKEWKKGLLQKMFV